MEQSLALRAAESALQLLQTQVHYLSGICVVVILTLLGIGIVMFVKWANADEQENEWKALYQDAQNEYLETHHKLTKLIKNPKHKIRNCARPSSGLRLSGKV